MIDLPSFVQTLRKDNRLLKIHNEQLKRSHLTQKQKADKLEQEIHHLRERNKQLEKEKEKLFQELEKTKAERDSYKNLSFKEKRECSDHHGTYLEISIFRTTYQNI